MTQKPIPKNSLGQALNIGEVIVYPKVVGTMKVRMTAGVIIDIVDHPVGTKLVVMVPESVRSVTLSNLSKVIVVDINSLELPLGEMEAIKEAIAAL